MRAGIVQAKRKSAQLIFKLGDLLAKPLLFLVRMLQGRQLLCCPLTEGKDGWDILTVFTAQLCDRIQTPLYPIEGGGGIPLRILGKVSCCVGNILHLIAHAHQLFRRLCGSRYDSSQLMHRLGGSL